MMDTAPDELKALRKAIYEQKKAFDAHIAPLRPDLWRFCRRLTGSIWDGEDLVQETLLRAFGALARVWSPINPKAYLFRIASRIWIDQNERQSPDQAPLHEDDAAETMDEGLSAEGHAAMELMVATLPPRQRVVFLLTQAFEFTAKEAAEMLEMTEGAVKAALHRARQSLASAPPESLPGKEAVPEVVQKFVDAFNRRDLDGLCALLHEDVRVDIVGIAEERGRDEAKGSSMKHTIEDEDASEAVVFWHSGEPLALYLKHLEDGSKAVSEVTRLTVRDGEVTELRTYYFCPETLEAVAEAFGLPAYGHGYHY